METPGNRHPLVSVIIPVYNAAYCVERCLDNLTASDYTRFEVLVVDDHSTDDTVERAAGYGCRILRQPTNQGAAAARNRGSREARGEILFFLDADVFLNADTLGIIVEDLTGETRADAVIGVYTRTQETRGFYSQYQNLFTIFNHEKSSGFIQWFWTAMGAVRRDAFLSTDGFNEAYTGASAEDVELGYALSRKGFHILYDNRIQGVHYHHHDLRSLLRNNFKKSAALVELIWKMSRDDKFAHGFSDRRNVYALGLTAVLSGSIVLALFDVRWLSVTAAALPAFVVANLPFYRFVRAEKGLGFLLQTIGLHILIYLTAGVGALLGTGKYCLRRHTVPAGPRGRSPEEGEPHDFG